MIRRALALANNPRSVCRGYVAIPFAKSRFRHIVVLTGQYPRAFRISCWCSVCCGRGDWRDLACFLASILQRL